MKSEFNLSLEQAKKAVEEGERVQHQSWNKACWLKKGNFNGWEFIDEIGQEWTSKDLDEHEGYYGSGQWRILDIQPEPVSEETKYPINGYAPGNYMCKCGACGQMFQGDKRAVRCEPCAIKMQGEDGTILEFLSGSHSYEGVWFGDPHPTRKGQFWWRQILNDHVADIMNIEFREGMSITGQSPQKTDLGKEQEKGPDGIERYQRLFDAINDCSPNPLQSDMDGIIHIVYEDFGEPVSVHYEIPSTGNKSKEEKTHRQIINEMEELKQQLCKEYKVEYPAMMYTNTMMTDFALRFLKSQAAAQ